MGIAHGDVTTALSIRHEVHDRVGMHSIEVIHSFEKIAARLEDRNAGLGPKRMSRRLPSDSLEMIDYSGIA
jgi:hypothetical protein